MKGIYWRTLTFKKSVIYLIKVNYTSYNYTPCNSTWTCLISDGIFATYFAMFIQCVLVLLLHYYYYYTMVGLHNIDMVVVTTQLRPFNVIPAGTAA